MLRQDSFDLADLYSDPGFASWIRLNQVDLLEAMNAALSTRWGTIRGVQARMLQYHPGSRCTVELALETASASIALIGKFYAFDRADVYEFMNALTRTGFGSEAEFSIPRPIAYLPELHLLLQERVQGPSVQDIFLEAEARARAGLARRCASWLARYQQAAPHAGPVFKLQDYLIDLHRWVQRLACLGEPIAGKAIWLWNQLEGTATRIREVEPRAGHGSYSPRQMVLAGERLVVYDWDSFDTADPNRDAARFVIASRRMALGRLGSTRALEAEVSAFEESYLDQAESSSRATLGFYKAALCVQLAKYDLGHRVSRWREKIEALLDEAIASLKEGN